MAIIDLDLILYLTCHTGKYQLQRSIPKVGLSWGRTSRVLLTDAYQNRKLISRRCKSTPTL